MGNGYYAPPQGEYGPLVDDLRRLAERLAELEGPNGTSMNSLVDQVQDAIANITTTVNAAIVANSYTKTQIDNLVANPPAGSNVTGNVTASGNVSAGGDVSSSGQVSSNGAPLKSQPSYNYVVTTSYKGVWIDGATFQLGYSSSAEASKKDLAQMTADDARRLLNLTPYWGRYVWDDESMPLKVFFLAEDVQAAGFGPDVAPVVEGEPFAMVDSTGAPVVGADGNPIVIPVGQAYTINYSQLVVPLIAAWRDGAEQMRAMKQALQDQAATIMALQANVQQLAAAADVTVT